MNKKKMHGTIHGIHNHLKLIFYKGRIKYASNLENSMVKTKI